MAALPKHAGLARSVTARTRRRSTNGSVDGRGIRAEREIRRRWLLTPRAGRPPPSTSDVGRGYGAVASGRGEAWLADRSNALTWWPLLECCRLCGRFWGCQYGALSTHLRSTQRARRLCPTLDFTQSACTNQIASGEP